ncbi:4-hydroxythreonine-4-phosphate dehydrogenase PdxA [bacterium]|nr:MAG: 4-hydroxythreonine-4-phosphate dehydrogenase PdxA [bacterium]
MGDPSGVGPEIVLKALSDKGLRRIANLVVVGDKALLEFLAKKLRLKPPDKSAVRNLSNLDIKRLKPGVPSKEAGTAMIRYVKEAARMALAREADAIVTAPITKEAAKMAGFKFPGHTEFIARLTNTKNFAMMLAGDELKVVLVTIHEPIKNLHRLVTKEAVLKTLKVTDAALRQYFGFKRPRIAVCGLNPHAGESGLFGDEEKKEITPAVKKAVSLGINAVGPLPADTVFYRAVRRKEFDCVVAMYHDQGLGPLKLLSFENGINVTLGLPIVRTSVDHGTAYDIAWKGRASHLSLKAAITAAVEMAKKKAAGKK